MKSNKNTITLILTLTLLATACNDVPFNPEEKQNPPTGETPFRLVEVTITGIGTDQMKAIVRPAGRGTAHNFTRPANADAGGDGTIQMEPVSNGSFTTGVRGTNGMRFLFATFNVRNARTDGTPYDTPRENLTFMAVDNSTTHGHTAVTELRLFDGTLLTGTPATNMAETIIPTGNVANSGGKVIPLKADVLQIITETEAEAITVPGGVDVFPFGFVTSTPGVTPGSRQLPASPAASQFDGIVTFAFKIPLEVQANQDPFEITMLFLPVDDSEVRLTQSLEEQTPEAEAAIAERAVQLNALYVSLLPGNSFTAPVPLRRICDPVRVAGPQAAPAAVLFPPPPIFVSLNPDPYGGSGHTISNTAAISATYDIAIQPANSNNFVVHGGQTGRLFTGGGYTNAGATVATPAGSFFPGEVVEVTLTNELGSCFPSVARYRVEAETGTGTFSGSAIPVGTSPADITAGDWDGDGDLDMAVANFNDNNVNLLANDGSGAFTETTVTVGSLPGSITAGDWDGDGDLDLATVNYASDDLSVLVNDGTGVFSKESTVLVGDLPQSVTAGDWNGDGDLDLAISNRFDATMSLLSNNGTGSFTEITVTAENAQTGVTAGDWDGDGDLDLAVANGNDDTVSLLANDGSDGFSVTTVSVGNDPHGIATGDWDGDSDLDLAVANAGGTVSLLANNGAGILIESTVSVGNFPISITTGDWDGDGDLDLAVANENDDTISLLAGDGTGGFSVTNVSVEDFPRSVTAADWDGDGDLDLAVANFRSGTVSLLTNQ